MAEWADVLTERDVHSLKWENLCMSIVYGRTIRYNRDSSEDHCFMETVDYSLFKLLNDICH